MQEDLPIPRTLEDITPVWLTGALTQSGTLAAGQRVVSVRLESAAGGIAATGCVGRLCLEIEPAGSTTPTHLFAKLRSPDWSGAPDLYLVEVRFYRDLASRVDLAVPKCHYADLDDDSGDFVLLLEDLTGASPGHPLEGCTLKESQLLMREAARLHRPWWGGVGLEDPYWSSREYAPERLRGWLTRFREGWDGLADSDRYGVDEKLKRAVARMSDDEWLQSHERLGQAPQTLIHCDLHVENFLLDDRDGTPRVWIFDWQDARRGHPARDVAYILAGDTAIEVQRESRTDLLRTYHAALVEQSAIEYDFDRLVDACADSIRWDFLFQVLFLLGFEPENPHDLRTLQLEWSRIAFAFSDWFARD